MCFLFYVFFKLVYVDVLTLQKVCDTDALKYNETIYNITYHLIPLGEHFPRHLTLS